MFYKLTLSFLLFFVGAEVMAQNFREMDSVFAMHQLRTNQHLYNVNPYFKTGSTSGSKTSVRKSFLATPLSIGSVRLPTIAGTQQPTIVCFDTSARSEIRNDTMRFNTGDPCTTNDGNVLLSGLYQNINPPYNRFGGFMVKCDYNGNVIWFKQYDSIIQGNTANVYNYYKVFELRDGSILLAGYTNDNTTTTGKDNLLFTKTDKNGNILWSKTYNSRIWGPNNGSDSYYVIQQIKQDPYSGDVFINGQFWTAGSSIIRISPTDGTIVWSKAYQIRGDYEYDRPYGIDVKQNELRLFSHYLGISCMYRINKATGDTIQTKFVTATDTSGGRVQFFGYDPLTVLNNGHYVLSGNCYGEFTYPWDGITPLYQAAVAEFDSNFNFIKAYCFKNSIQGDHYSTKTTVYPDMSGFFTMLNFNTSTAFSDVYSVQFKDGQILQQRIKHYGGDYIPSEPHALRLPDGGDLIVRQIDDSVDNLSRIDIVKLHVADTSSSCLGTIDHSTYVYNFTFAPVHYVIDSVRPNVFQETINKTIIAKDIVTYRLPACYQVSHCDSLKLIPSANSICLLQNLQVVTHRNVGCGGNVFWQYDTSKIKSAVQLNDSTFAFHFNAPWAGYIYGSIQGCTIITDSVYIKVLNAPASLNLGPDTTICPNNNILLNAHAGYATYHWQNGSVDSLFMVTQPGTYYVQTTDACGGIYNDTVIVAPRTTMPVSIGLDRVKCNADTVHLSATAGFSDYSWSPNYNISALNNPSVIVHPLVDTTYYMKAESTPGCFSLDTIHITVNHSMPIRLGNDTSFCMGQFINLDAGPNFNIYQWNDGTTNEKLIADKVGVYSVAATTVQGCRSYDTLQIKNVYALPVVLLDHRAGLCLGTAVTFDAGSFSAYQWQDGSAGRFFTAQGLGTYSVAIIDKNGCHGSDTTKITAIFPLPTDFLPADTSVCSYGTITIQPLKSFNSYVWNTASISSAITVAKPGIYWLEAKDNNNCIGRDSITIGLKECMKGLYVPSGFTPNQDNKNDKLRVFLFGDIKLFDLKIYNRFGQLVFQTNDYNNGWDGAVQGINQNTGLYVWVCKYQLVGDLEKVERGTSLLIR